MFILRQICHDWPDDATIRILKSVRVAMGNTKCMLALVEVRCYGTCSSFLCVHSSSPPVLMLAHCHWASLLPSCSCHCRLDLPPFMLCSWAVHAVWLAIATCHAVRQACQGSIAFIRHVKIQLQCMRTPGVVRVCHGEAAACFALRLLPASNF